MNGLLKHIALSGPPLPLPNSILLSCETDRNAAVERWSSRIWGTATGATPEILAPKTVGNDPGD